MRIIGRAWALLLMAMAMGSVAADNRVMETYPLYTPEVAVVVSVAESVASPGSRVLYDKTGGRLLILATAEDHVRLREVLNGINQPLPNVRIEVSIKESGQQELSSIGVSGEGTVVVTDDDTEVSGTVKPRVQSRAERRSRGVKQTLLLQSGGEAVLRVGEEVPNAEWLTSYGQQQGYAPVIVETREVGAVLRVHARVIGDGPLISLKLTPEFTEIGKDGVQGLIFTRLSTDVTVEDGATISLGGLDENSEFFSRFLIGADREGKRRALTITLTPHIEHPAAP